jgi:hypothetical protein
MPHVPVHLGINIDIVAMILYTGSITMSMPITHAWPYHALELSELSY